MSKTPKTSDSKKQKVKKLASKPVRDSDIKQKSDKSLDIPPLKNNGDGCVAFEMKEIRAKVSSALDMLSVTKTLEDESSENSILVDFRRDGCMIHYLKSGAYACLEVTGTVFKPGAFVVDAGLFRAIKGDAPFVYFIINRESNAVEFKCGRTKGSVQLLNTAKEYLAQAPEPLQGNDVVLAKTLIVDTFSKLLFNSFDPAIPALGLPLNISSGKNGITVTSNDNIVGSLYSRLEKACDKFKACVPGQSFIKIAKNMPYDTVRCSFSENMFRIRCKGVDVTHPSGTYDLVDLLSWLEEDKKLKPDYEIILPTNQFIDAIDSAMCMSVIDKTESNISVEFGPDSGKVIFLGSNTQSRSTFPVTKILKAGKQQSFITNGKRILSFIALLKGFKEFRLRVSQGRAYLFAPDESFVFLVPLS